MSVPRLAMSVAETKESSRSTPPSSWVRIPVLLRPMDEEGEEQEPIESKSPLLLSGISLIFLLLSWQHQVICGKGRPRQHTAQSHKYRRHVKHEVMVRPAVRLVGGGGNGPSVSDRKARWAKEPAAALRHAE